MNRSSTDRAEARLSLTIFLALSFLSVGLFALTARSGTTSKTASAPADVAQIQANKIQWIISGVVNFQQLATQSQASAQIAPQMGPESATSFLTATNDSYRVQNPAGVQLDVSAGSLWAAVSATNPIAPRVQQDADNDRWIVAGVSDAHTASASILVGISQTSDPAGDYVVFRVPARISSDLLNVNVPDSPVLRFDKDSLVVSINMLDGTTGAFSDGRSLVIDYRTLRTGILSGTYFTGLSAIAISETNGPGRHPLPPIVPAADQTWDGSPTGNGTAWYSVANWLGDIGFAGSQTVTTNTDIATIGSTGNNPSIGINGTTSANLYLGGIDFNGANRGIGDSAAGSLTLNLNGATINAVSNVIVRNSGAGNLTLQPMSGGAGTMTVALGNATDNIINIDSTGGVTISTVLKNGAGNHLTLSGAGTGALTLSAANTYSGGTTINASTLIAMHDGALGTGNVSVTATGATLQLQGGTLNDYISDTATLSIANGAMANLSFTGTDVVGGLILGGVVQTQNGSYGSLASGADHQFDTFFTPGSTGTVTLQGAPTPTPPPTATTNPATNVTDTSATLNGTVNPNGSSTTVFFQWGTDKTYGNQTANQIFTGNTDQSVSANLSLLTPGTTYHYRIVATNGGGTVMGSDAMFMTAAPTPTPTPSATTNAATNVTGTGATLNGTVNPNGSSTTVFFQWGTDKTYGNQTANQIFTGNTSQNVTDSLSGLALNTTYHYRIVAMNGGGTTFGNDVIFMTLAGPPPTVTTNAATSVTNTGATLNGAVNPNGASTTVHFEYGTSIIYGSVTSNQVFTGSTSQSVMASISGLVPGTLYHFRLVGTSSGGTTNGADMTFTTVQPAPTITTTAATNVTTTAATLNGTVNPNGAMNTTVHFDYGTDMTYGSQTANQIFTGTTSQNVTANISALTPNTLYHFRLVGSNTGGTTNGNDLTFMTAAPTPTPTPSPCPNSITQSSSQQITAGNSVACISSGTDYHKDNSYWRAFNMATFAGGQPYVISSVSFGIQEASSDLAGRNAQPVDVRLYTNNGASFPNGTRTQLGSTVTLNVTNQSGTVFVVPFAATVPAGTSELVMEVHTQNGVATQDIFYIGSNSAQQTGPSYISAADCSLAAPTDLALIGYPNMHVVMNVNGNCFGSGTPTPTPTATPTATPTVTPTPTPTLTCPPTITQSLSQAVVQGNSVACRQNVTFYTLDNSYWRAFNMANFDGGQAYNVSSVSFGIEQATSGSGGGQSVIVNLYANSGQPFPNGTLATLGSVQTIMPDQAGTVLNLPLAVVVPAGTLELVMEVHVPDGTTTHDIFFIGSNAAGQTGPSYQSAVGCGISSPTDLATFGHPNMHIVMNVNGSCGGPTPPPAPGGVLYDPPPCSALTSPETFHWTAGSASTAYWLTIGDDNAPAPTATPSTTPVPCGPAPCSVPKYGGSNIFSSGQTGGLSWNVGSLPTDGRKLYVRLLSRINNVWSGTDYFYTAPGTIPYTPTISPNGGTFTNQVTVTLADFTPCVTIRYTTNGTDPTATSTQYTAPFNLTGAGTKVVKAKAFRTSDSTESAIASATFTIH